MAGLFTRLNDIFNANFNDLLDKMEDPERMIKQIIREMEENLAQAKEGVIDAIASEKQLKKELQKQQDQAIIWQKKAETALKSDREDLARSALIRKKEIDSIIDSLQPAWTRAKDTSNRLRQQLQTLETRLEEARHKRTALLARQQAAYAQQQMDATLHKVNTGLNAQARFNRMEDNVSALESRLEAEAELNQGTSPLDQALAELEEEQDIDHELAALKQKMQQDS